MFIWESILHLSDLTHLRQYHLNFIFCGFCVIIHYCYYLFIYNRNDTYNVKFKTVARGGSRTAATSKMERFVIIVNG